MNDPHQNSPSPSQNQALTRFRVINFIEDQMRSGQLLADALRQGAVRPWPDENGDYYAVRTIEDWWYAFKKGGFQALQPATRCDHGKNRVLDEATATWVLEQVALNPAVNFKVLFHHWKEQGRPLPSISVLYRFLRRQGYDRRTAGFARLGRKHQTSSASSKCAARGARSFVFVHIQALNTPGFPAHCRHGQN